MMNHLRAKWQATDDDLSKVLERVRIIHLDGQLGSLAARAADYVRLNAEGWPANEGRPAGSMETSDLCLLWQGAKL